MRNKRKEGAKGALSYLPALLLMAILAKPLLALVSGHFMALALLSAWHVNLVGNSEKFVSLLSVRFQLSDRQDSSFSQLR